LDAISEGLTGKASRARLYLKFVILKHEQVFTIHSLFKALCTGPSSSLLSQPCMQVELLPIEVGHFAALCDVVTSLEPLDAGRSSKFRGRGLLLHTHGAILLASGACLMCLSDGSAAGTGRRLVMQPLRSLTTAPAPGFVSLCAVAAAFLLLL